MTAAVGPSLVRGVCCPAPPGAGPSASGPGALVDGAEPVAVVAPPPPSATLPAGHMATLPDVVMVTTPTVPSRPAGPCGPLGPVGPATPCAPAGPPGPATP